MKKPLFKIAIVLCVMLSGCAADDRPAPVEAPPEESTLFSVWVSEGEQDVLDLRRHTLNEPLEQNLIMPDKNLQCLCSSLLEGTEKAGFFMIDNCTGKASTCRRVSVFFEYEHTDHELRLAPPDGPVRVFLPGVDA